MKNVKLMLLGIAIILLGICAILLSGLQGTPTFHNDIYELSAVICPIVGVILSAFGFFMKDSES